METFFQSDSRIKSWLEQIIEKIFTVCLLKGTGSELAEDFAKGRQLVVKVTMLLTDISSLPPTAVVDAIHQLLEQRLPDQRIIEKFPNFYQVMEDMIREGIAIVSENGNPISEQNFKSLDSMDIQKQPMLQKPTSVIVLAGGREPMLTPKVSGSYMTINSNNESVSSSIQNLSKNILVNPRPNETIEKSSMVHNLADIDLCLPENLGIPVLAAVADLITGKNIQVTSTCNALDLTEIDQSVSNLDQENTEFSWVLDKLNTMPLYDDSITGVISSPQNREIKSLTTTKERLNIPTEKLKPSNIEQQQNPSKDLPLSKNRVRNSSQVPAEATRLALVLQQIFPNTQARWNFDIGKNNFLVQIKDLLIYIETLSEGNRVEKEMKKEGWKIMVCNTEDLSFPRRLEREIHRVLKDSKYNL